MKRWAGVVVGLVALAAPATSQAQNRFELANGCYVLRAQSQGALVVKEATGSYTARGANAGEAEHFRMKATALGHYLFYGRAGDFMALKPELLPLASQERVGSEPKPSPNADWRVEPAGNGSFRIVLPSKGKALAVSAAGGGLVLADRGRRRAVPLRAARAAAPTFPEVELNATGTPARGRSSYGEVRGLIDAHMHMMAFEFLGGRAHCGRPWHRYGVAYALVDCPDH